MSDLYPSEMGNEDWAWLALLERAAVSSGTRVCLCSHLEIEHRGGECARPLCGCGKFRPAANTSSMASREPEFSLAAGRGAA